MIYSAFSRSTSILFRSWPFRISFSCALYCLNKRVFAI